MNTLYTQTKRLLDMVVSLGVLLASGPALGVLMFFIWKQDRGFPLYLDRRVGRGGQPFRMIKLRSMYRGADKTGVKSTSTADARITPIGHFIRRYKLDELTQFWNVLIGEMSLVGPRPQVPEGVYEYTPAERRLLEAKPGLTDISSIVFADEGDILNDAPDPDAAYDRLIRPWKSRFGLFYLRRRCLTVDLAIIGITALSLFSRRKGLEMLVRLLGRLGADEELLTVARRNCGLPLGTLPI